MTSLTNEHAHHLLLPADLVKEIDRLHENLQAEQDQLLRTQADFKNYRRRIELDGNKFADEGKREIMLPLLDILDDMEKALQWSGNREQILTKGVQNIHQKLVVLLETIGVRSFDSEGELFTPSLHEAVAVTEQEELNPGTIVKELRRGYLWKDKLLRPAQVQVAG